MNILSIVSCNTEYQGVDKSLQKWSQAEFIVDDKPLSECFSFAENGPWFGATFLEQYNPKNNLDEVLGRRAASNQFGTGRFVLYRCHCGCDYCGVISCVIEKKNNVIMWKDIYFENDDEKIEGDIILQYEFNYIDYAACINEFIKTISMRR